MDSSKPVIRKHTSIIIIFTLIVLCGYLLNNIFSIAKEISNKEDIITKLDNQIVSQNENILSLSEKLSYCDTLEDSLKQIKEKYFENAFKADELARNGKASFKVCYLTFDDGPYLLTDTFLDILEEKDVLATFFTRKRTDEEYVPIYLREKINGHTIGNHTASHQISKGIYRSNKTFIDDILENREFINNMLGITTDIMRFPGGSYQATYMGLNKDSLVKELNEIGYGYVDWTHASGDGGTNKPANVFLHNVVDYTEDDNVIVILLHDYSQNTAKCLPDMIDILRKQGYIFLPLWYDSPAVNKK